MPKLSDIVPSRSWLTVPFGPSALRVAYRPGVVTPRLQKAVAAARDTQDVDAGLLAPLCQLIDSWDLTDDGGDAVALTPEGLADVPAAVLLAILEAIGEDMAPNRPRAGASRNGSSPDGSEPALTGTSS